MRKVVCSIVKMNCEFDLVPCFHFGWIVTPLEKAENKFDFLFSGLDFGSFSVLKPYFPMYIKTFLTVLPKIFSLL